jgi:VIT1/CCC1 family predicted Fe2+/Mn2+ transporter
MEPAVAGLRSRNLERASIAFMHRDPVLSRAAHSQRRIDEEPHRSNKINQVASKVIITLITTGSTGLITSSVVVVGMISAFNQLLLHLPNWPLIVILTVLVIVIASGLATALMDATNKRSEIAFYNSEKKRETWEYDNYLEGEQREMVELYTNKGMTHADAEKVVLLLSKYRELFVDIMMAEELHLMPVDDRLPPLGAGITILCSYIFFGMLPLSPLYMAQPYYPHLSYVYYSVFAITIVFLFILGLLKSYYFVINKGWQSALAHTINGTFAVASAVFVGSYLNRYISHT